MISEETAMDLVRNLSWMDRFPDAHESGMEALLSAFMEIAHDEDHAKKIIGDVQRTMDRCPTPHQLIELAISSAPRYEPEFKPRKRLPDEKPFHGDGIYEIWTKRDYAICKHLAEHGKTKHAKEYGKQMIAGFLEWAKRHPDRDFAPYQGIGIIPYRHDVRCHVCNDSGFQYIEVPENMGPGTVKQCVCRAVFHA